MAPLKDITLTVRVILLLTCILDVGLTCSPPQDFAELPICRDAKQTGWSFYIDTLLVLQNNAGVCKCSLNISEAVQDVQMSYTYQNPSSYCNSTILFNLANLTLKCNATATTLDAGDVDEVEFRKETNGQTESACLLIYLDRNLDPATVTCYKSTTWSTLVTNATTPLTSNIVTTSDNTMSVSSVSSTSTSAQTSTELPNAAETKSLNISSTTPPGMTSTTELSKFNEIIVIAVVAGVGGFLLVLVLIVICITCCRSTHSTAMYDVKRKQLDSTSTSDIDLTENAFYNVALVNSPNFYS